MILLNLIQMGEINKVHTEEIEQEILLEGGVRNGDGAEINHGEDEE